MKPLKVYRIGNPLFIEDLSGEGGRLYAGRWNHKGTPILYTAQSASLAVLEYLGHVINTAVNVPYVLLELEVDTEQVLPLESFTVQLPDNWYEERGIALTRNIGTDWIKSKKSAILQVSIITLLANRLQQQGKLQIATSAWYKKEKPTFSDVIAAVRRLLWNKINFSTSDNHCDMIKIPKPLLSHFQHVLAHAA